MPAQLQFFDMSINKQEPAAFVPLPVTLGPNWQPNDIRLFLQLAWIQGSTGDYTSVPPGYTNFGYTGFPGFRMCYRRLVAGDTDTFVQYANPTSFNAAFSTLLCTVRGVAPSVAPTNPAPQFGELGTLPAVSSTGGSVSAWTFSVPVGAALVWMNNWHGTQAATGCTWGAPSGWTNLVATDGSGATYTPFGAQDSVALFAKAFSSAGSTGAFSVQYGAERNARNYMASIGLTAAADVSATGGSASAAATSANATGGATNVVTATGGNATSVATSSTAFNPLQGYWISDPLTLPGDPVTGSVIRWAGNTPSGATAVVETSINNGASWDLATNNRSVPRLKAGDTNTRGVLARISLTRTLATDPAPTMSYLEMQVSNDVGTDELVPIGHGMIDKVTTKTVGGSTGGGSTTSGVGSSAVTSKGGGQTGGGTNIKIHVTDLSRAIKMNVWQMPFVVPKGTNYGDAVKAMVLDRLPSQTEFAISTTTRVLDTALVYGLDQGGDPWQDIREVAIAIGFEAYFDPRGVFVFRAVPDPRIGEPVFVFDEDFNPIVAEASKELSDEQTYNDIVVTGQSSSSANPVSAEAFDNDPTSRTYILGDFGRRTQRLVFNNVTTQDQAQDAANAVLFNSLGAAETVTITNVPHPALEPGDVVKIKVSNVKVDGTYMINSMTTPMSPAEAQQLVCFRQSTNA
jgi:Putative phage tail protein